MVKNKSEEELFLEKYDKEKYEKISVAVDLLVFTVENDELKLLVIKRNEMPYKDYLALPGVFVGVDESLEEAVKRGIREETGVENIYFEQLYTWGEVDRDPRMRIISVSYMALVPLESLRMRVGMRVSEVLLMSVDELLEQKDKIGFDHGKIIEYARERLRNKVEYSKIAFELVPKEFTLPQLQRIYEIILGHPLYKANFRKKISEMICQTDRYTSGNAHRPSQYYRLKE
ncbi:MAG: NUDIX domain-containing protein [Lachnospiraceae bacterium]|nr:NUDIX domain-containing protein [Lachnospiraceae bacterium]